MAVFMTLQLRVGGQGGLTVPSESEWTVERLKKAVADLDELDSGPGQGISPEHVSGVDILEFIFTQQLGLDIEVISENLFDVET